MNKFLFKNAESTETKLEQVFFYITGKCNASCIMCYLGENYNKCDHVPLNEIIERLKKYREFGAHKATFLGGEATLHPQMGDILVAAKEIGYSYLRLTTNGMFKSSLLETRKFSYLNTIAFSIDGYNEEINSYIRPKTSLDRILYNMRKANELGFDVRINSTVTSININYIERIIELALKNGASQVNLNIVFLEGEASNKSDLGIPPEQWIEKYNDILKLKERIPIELKVPLGYGRLGHDDIDESKTEELINKINKRIYCMQDGTEYKCLLFINDSKDKQCGVCDCNSGNIPFCNKIPKFGDFSPFCLDYKDRLTGIKIMKERSEKIEK